MKFMICPQCHKPSRAGQCMWCAFDVTDPQANARLRAQQAAKRAKGRATRAKAYHFLNALFQFNLSDFVAFLQHSAKWTLLGSMVGALAGTASALFLISLAWATQVRLAHGWLLFCLPLAGFGLGWLYYRFGGRASLGNNLVIDEVNNNQSSIPLRMAPFVLIGTVLTHLFGGSAGREGTAIQMGASQADGLARLVQLPSGDRRLMLMAGISGGFASVFGVPVAGFVFGMEVQSVGRIRYEGIVPCLVAAYVGDLVTRAWGAEHSHYPALVNLAINPLLLLKVAAAGLLFGLTSLLFIELTHGIKYLMQRLIGWPPLYPVVGGCVVILLTWLVGTQDYLGLSLPLAQKSMNGVGVPVAAFILKLLFTAITLGAGFPGGEVTPLFVIGSTLGYTLGRLLGVDPAFMAAIGLVAVFAGASNTPLACALMGIEVFGGGSALYLFLGCVLSYLASGHRSIYVTQAVDVPKGLGGDLPAMKSLKALAARRPGWLPPVPGISGAFAHRPLQTMMSAAVVAVPVAATVAELIDLALQSGVRAFPVINADKQVLGMVTDSDLERRGLETTLSLLKFMSAPERSELLRRGGAMPVTQIMSQPALTLGQNATLAEALLFIHQHNLKRLPLVDATGRLAGILTRSDLLRELAFAAPAAANDADLRLNWDAQIKSVALEPAVSVTLTTPLHTTLQLMNAYAQKRVAVTDVAGGVLGLISSSDLLARTPAKVRPEIAAALRRPTQPIPLHLTQTAASLMTTPVLTVQRTSLALDALRLLLDHQIKRLPVVDGTGRLLGFVGRAGLLHVLLAAS
jgi:H+/Cl- antiporter ClcA/CBS-domain-containing membrane protein